MNESKRQLLVDTATVLFSEHGFQAVGVDWIIRESGVVRMTLYRHFAGKDELICEVLLQRHAKIFQSLEKAMEGISDPVQRVKCIFDWYQSWFCTPEFAGCLFERALAEFGTKRALISDTAVRFRTAMTALISTTLKASMPLSEAKQLASVFMMLLDGATVEARATDNSSSAAIAWRTAASLIQQKPQKNRLSVSNSKTSRLHSSRRKSIKS